MLIYIKEVAAIKTGGQTEITATIDRLKIARLGINVSDVNNAIQAAFAGKVEPVFKTAD